MRWSAEERIFGAALAVIALHALAAVASALAGVAVIALAAAAGIAFVRSGRLVRTVLAGALGLVAAADGLAVHVAAAVLDGPRALDITGALAAIAGVVLIGLAFHVALHGRRRRAKLLAIPVCLVVAQWFAVPVLDGGVATNVRRERVPAAATLGLPGARDVTFASRDGVRLAGWYAPGRNGAAVVLLHGSHGDRADTLAHLRLVARAGYAVLAYDARGHGASAGQTNALGWRGADDLAGAVAFVGRQGGVDRRRIAAIGLSMGAEEALRAAAEGVTLRAVVADGAGASTTGDARLLSGAPIPLSVNWMGMRATEILAGEAEPAPLRDLAAKIRVPVLLIASRADGERKVDDVYRRRIGPRADLWYVADAAHTKALAEHPAAYAARVLGFLRSAVSP